jgi:hypothetical protein
MSFSWRRAELAAAAVAGALCIRRPCCDGNALPKAGRDVTRCWSMCRHRWKITQHMHVKFSCLRHANTRTIASNC